MKKIIFSCVFFLPFVQAQALSIDWTGNYRFEYTEINKTSLDSPGLRKSYILNHLSLSPKIIAADGVNIVGKFEILPNEEYPESQAGQRFGKAPRKQSAGTNSSTKDDSAVAGQKQGVSSINVSQLYLNVNQEFGSLLVGRAPIDFGLGISHSAGNDPFDHWYDTHDMIGYKIIVGNLSFMPIVGKVYDYSVAQGREIQDVIWDIEYNNPETESAIGVFHQTRTASVEANDAPFAAYRGTGVTGGWNTQSTNLYFSRGFESVKFKMEAGFQSGGTGIVRDTDEVSLGSYGIATELDFPTESKSRWSLKAGIASGDNPSTKNYEGFHFSRNYDVAFMLFNHPLGKFDLFTSGAQRTPDYRTTTANTSYSTDEAIDEETISNAIYIAPKLSYTMSDKWSWNNTITWAQLQTNPQWDPVLKQSIDTSKDLGFEWDTSLVFKPHERIMWVNEIGFLFPGSAWQGGPSNYGNGFTYGFQSKAAISF